LEIIQEKTVSAGFGIDGHNRQLLENPFAGSRIEAAVAGECAARKSKFLSIFGRAVVVQLQPARDGGVSP
jgi:hypothetical protein